MNYSFDYYLWFCEVCFNPCTEVQAYMEKTMWVGEWVFACVPMHVHMHGISNHISIVFRCCLEDGNQSE